MNLDDIKKAKTSHNILDVIKNRWSPRSFDDKQVDKSDLAKLFEAARWAPSSFNEQPWSFIVANRELEETYNKLREILVPFNESWAKTAPVLALSVAKKHFDKNNNKNAHARHDVGLATGNLLAQATELDLYVHQMAGFDSDKAVDLFNIPDDTHEPVTAFAIGYLGKPDQLSGDLARQEKNPRSRKQISDFVFTGNWNKKADFLM